MQHRGDVGDLVGGPLQIHSTSGDPPFLELSRIVRPQSFSGTPTLFRFLLPCSPFRLHSIPFFFEPNFTALVRPLPAALRILRHEKAGNEEEVVKAQKAYPPVVYGEFLRGKVGGNFTEESQSRERY